MFSRQGATLIDLLISLGIIVLLFGGIYAVFFSILGATSNIEARTAAIELINQQIEIIRGMSYDSVGTVNGIPPGVIPQQQSISLGGYAFSLQTTVRNIDDPFDGTTGGNPNDTAPADYKLVQFDVACPLCAHFAPLLFSTTVAPKNLESASNDGSIFVNVYDVSWAGVPLAAVRVINNSVVPSIDLTDTTNASGVLQLVGVPTSTQAYEIMVTKPGYSTDRTYPPGPSNPNPKPPHATVAAQTVTPISFQIDRSSTLNVISSGETCGPISNIPFSFYGSKTIGINPDVFKFSTSSATNASGARYFSNIEWDTYNFTQGSGSHNLRGMIPLSPYTISPSSTADFRFVLSPTANPSLLVAVVDSVTGAGIKEASVSLSKTGFSETLITGHSLLADTDWSSGAYSSQSGGINTEGAPGQISLAVNASGTYDAGITNWLISNSIDLGGSSSTIYSVSWNPASQPAQTTFQVQLAANNDNAAWNFVGPDGTPGTYFTASGTTPAALNGKRYLRYEAFLSTNDPLTTPALTDISFDFDSACVPPAQVLFKDLSQGTYDLDVTAANYFQTTTTVAVDLGFQTSTISLTPQ